MIIGCHQELKIGSRLVTIIADYQGITHEDTPVMAIRQATREEWVQDLKNHDSWRGALNWVHFPYYYLISVD